ncbi:MAG: tetratricopeptide repeat protein [Bacteroidales bacterium]|nr:tetratricopeptide repeat protein [Bacteroidales bacterium]
MKTQKKVLQVFLLSIFTLLILLNNVNANSKDKIEIKKMAYRAYLMNSENLWKEVIKHQKEINRNETDDFEKLLNLSFTQYGLLYSCVANKDEDTFDKYVDIADENVDKLISLNEKNSQAHALKASIYGLKMAFSPYMGMFYGAKSDMHIEKAIECNKNEPLAWIQKASSKLHTPKLFGGNISEAIKYYKKAIELYETDKVEYNWHYIDALAWLGISYQNAEMTEEAINTYKKALKIEPDFAWIKYVLLPKAEKK